MTPVQRLAEVAQVLWSKEQAGHVEPSEVDEMISALLELPVEGIAYQVRIRKR
jgi:hypothetical protein